MGLSFIIIFLLDLQINNLPYCKGFTCSLENEVRTSVDKFPCSGVLCYACAKYNDGSNGDANEISRKQCRNLGPPDDAATTICR